MWFGYNCELGHFSLSVYRQLVPLVYCFVPIIMNICMRFFMVSGCACGLVVIVRFFFHFFHIVNLVIFHPQYIDSGYLVSTNPHTILYKSFPNFAHVFSIV